MIRAMAMVSAMAVALRAHVPILALTPALLALLAPRIADVMGFPLPPI